MANPALVHERVGVTITREDEPRALTACEIQYPAYKAKKQRDEARRRAVEYALTKAIEPKSPIMIDWATNAVFISEGGWTRQVAVFDTEQYQIDSQVVEAV